MEKLDICKNVLSNIPDGFIFYDINNTIIDYNEAFIKMCGLEKGIELRGSKAADLFKLIKVDKSIKTLVPFFPKKINGNTENAPKQLKTILSRTVDRKVKYIRRITTPIYNDDGKYLGRFCILTDITEVKENENKLKKQKEELLNTQERLRKFNDFIKKIQGEINEEDIYHDALVFLKQNVKANQILIKNIDFDSQRVNVVTSLKPVGSGFIESKEITHNPSLCYIIRENKPFIVKDINKDYTCRYHIYPQKSGGYICVPISFNSRVQGLIHIFNLEKDYFTDEVVNFVVDVANTISSYIMALKVYKEAHFYATVDFLTKAFNRRFAESFLEKEIARAGRNKAIFSILMFDLDNFKDINDKYGHKIGDITLKMFVNFLKESLRSCDVISRFGGDEFMVILPDTDAGGAKSIIKKVKGELKKKKFTLKDDVIINLSASIGFATYLEDGKTIDDLYLKGDKRLYEMKKYKSSSITEKPCSS